ncbi:RNA polymerase principal sigma factor HrdB [Nocardiopsis dassonvillei]|uniref:sigma-70 factor domain-containing protein n=1 Tax=Nocardiopsis dassonvillei TaxID=2014 RepID=UPI003F56108F
MSITTGTLTHHPQRISRTPLLTAEQEFEPGERLEAGRAARRRLDSGGDTPAEAERLRGLAEDGLRARSHMVEAALRLVVPIAGRYAAGGRPPPDLVQEGASARCGRWRGPTTGAA